MERDKVLLIFLAVAILLVISFALTSATGNGIKGLLRGGGKCTSNGYECGDCIDNDGDDLIDYKVNPKGKIIGDPDCVSLTDNTESPCSPLCNRNSDCGINSYVGNPYCGVDGNVYRDYRTYICYNPSECTASCDSQTESYLWQYCDNSAVCVEGTCVGGGNSTS